MKKLKYLAFVLLFFVAAGIAAASGCDGAGGCYVLPSASGTTCADWGANACSIATALALPSATVRGATIWVGAGTYTNGGNGFLINYADSGTSVVTFQAPTISSHGTATGWSNAFVGQALFTGGRASFAGNHGSVVDIETDYVTWNGAYSEKLSPV